MPKSSQRVQHWWVIASKRDPNHSWHWREFFEDYDNPHQSHNWGGQDWIKSPASFAYIKEMREGDTILAYQALV